jgi:hypothetical protein
MVKSVSQDLLADHIKTVISIDGARISHGNLQPDSFKKAQKDTAEHLQLLQDLTFPWQKGEQDTTMATEARMLRQAWIEEFGDPDSPEVQRQIQNTVEALRTIPDASQMQSQAEDLKRKVQEKQRDIEELIRKRQANRTFHRGRRRW